MESERKINWLSLFIRVVIIFIILIIMVWLLTKIFNRNKLSEAFISRFNNVKEVSIEYFKKIDLPLDKGKDIKVSLEELLEEELNFKDKEELKNNCDVKKSYSRITKKKSEYEVETKLKCGEEEKTEKERFELKYCKNCNGNKDDNTEKNNQSEDNKITDNSSNNESSNTLTYYEHVKETITYTKWMKGDKKANNIENKYEYYLVDSKEYYSLGTIKNNEVTYTLKLKNIPDNKKYFTLIEESSHFNPVNISYTKEELLINNNDIDEKDVNGNTLSEEDYTYELRPYYRKGNFYVTVTVKLNKDVKLNKEKIYFVPIKFTVKFASGEITNTKPEGGYETISYYRYIEKNREVKWSTEEYIEGYTKTGNTQNRAK